MFCIAVVNRKPKTKRREAKIKKRTRPQPRVRERESSLGVVPSHALLLVTDPDKPPACLSFSQEQVPPIVRSLSLLVNDPPELLHGAMQSGWTLFSTYS